MSLSARTQILRNHLRKQRLDLGCSSERSQNASAWPRPLAKTGSDTGPFVARNGSRLRSGVIVSTIVRYGQVRKGTAYRFVHGGLPWSNLARSRWLPAV